MNGQEVHAKLKAQFGEAVGGLSEAKIDPFVVVQADRIVEICRFAKDDPGLGFDYCEDVAGIDWPARNCIEVVYHLFSLQHRHAIVLKVVLDRAQPSLPTVEGVWKAANWLEREVYDMLGVNFAGHPDMRRILLPDDWVGHPLRKDYQEAGGYHGVSNTRLDPLVRMSKRVEEVRKEVQAAAPTPAPPAPAAAVTAAPATPSGGFGTDNPPRQPPPASQAPVAATPSGGFGTDNPPRQPPPASQAPVAATPSGGFGTDNPPRQPPPASQAPVAATPSGGFGTDNPPRQPPPASQAPVATRIMPGGEAPVPAVAPTSAPEKKE